MHDLQEQSQDKFTQQSKNMPGQRNVFFVIFFKTMYNKTIVRFGFCEIWNNQGLNKCYRPQPLADNTY